MTITALPAAPSRSDPPALFISKSDAFIASLPQFGNELNAMGTAYNLATTATSVSSVLIGTGSKSFTVAAGLGFVIGMSVTIANTAAPANRMYGFVTAYSSTTLTVNVTSTGGSGTFAAWTIALAAEILGATLSANTFTADQTLASGAAFEESMSTVASSATPDIWTNTSNVINYTGTVTATGFAAAPQAGARRSLICAAACSFTAGANMLIDGTVSYTGAAGDVVEVYAVTTTQFRLKIIKEDGTSVVSTDKIQPITASVAANALTITLNPTSLDFRSATLSSGTVNTRTISAAISLTISSGSTLGTVSAQKSRIVVLAIDNAGTVELAAVNLAGGNNLSETGLISTTAEGGAGGADSSNVIYSTTARTNVPYRVVGYVESTQATAGTWATSPSTIQGYGGQALAAMSSLGYGQAWQDVTGSRVSGTTYYNTTEKPILVSVFSSSSGTGATILSASEPGVIEIVRSTVYSIGAGYGASILILVPPYKPYAVALSGSAAGTIAGWTELR